MPKTLTYTRGNKGRQVKEIQEWLCLRGCQTAIDADFGPATGRAVNAFQKRVGLAQTGVVDAATYEALVAPLRAALAPIAPGNRPLGKMIVSYAQQHLKQRPLEVGGENMGPWVRLYTGGREGKQWPWCAGFASFMLREACNALGVPMPIEPSVSCDSLATAADAKGLLLRQPAPQRRKDIQPGTLFLVRRTITDWTHTGIVVKAGEETFETIEGNTNDSGDREGYEVCSRIRAYKGKDFICL